MGWGLLVSMSLATKVNSAVSCSCPACSSSMRMSTLLLPVHTTRPVICRGARHGRQSTHTRDACSVRYSDLVCACCPPTHTPAHPPATRPNAQTPTHPHVLFQVELAATQLDCLHPCSDHQRRAAGLVRNIAAGPGQPVSQSGKFAGRAALSRTRNLPASDLCPACAPVIEGYEGCEGVQVLQDAADAYLTPGGAVLQIPDMPERMRRAEWQVGAGLAAGGGGQGQHACQSERPASKSAIQPPRQAATHSRAPAACHRC